jgi:hypothetical protein
MGEWASLARYGFNARELVELAREYSHPRDVLQLWEM